MVKKTDYIVASMTSWKKRIGDVPHTIRLMSEQTLRPDRIVLNLAEEEFPGKEKDLPRELTSLIGSVPNFEIFWVKKNTKPYKKLIPSLERFPNDVIITVDDDVEYPKNFVELMYCKFLDYGKKSPVTGSHFKWDGDIFIPNGGFNLVKKEFFGPYLDDLYNDLYLKDPAKYPFSDLIFAYAILLNGKRYKAIETDMNKIRMKTHDNKTALTNYNSVSNKAASNEEHKLIREYIKRKYGKTYDDLLAAPIIVNFTTWKKRDWCVPFMIEEFKKQTLKPSKIFCWLSREEYDEKNLPESLAKGEANSDFEIKWVDKNTYCHKRHEVFKEYNDCYNIFIDDDNIYPPSLLKELYTASKSKQNTIISYIGYTQEYEGTQRKMNPYKKNLGDSFKHTFLGNGVVFPPYIFPYKSFEYANMRDKITPVCDESWLVPWFIKNDVKFNVLHDRSQMRDFKHFEGSQDSGTAVFVDMNKNSGGGVRNKEKYFSGTIKFLGIEDKVKKIWPKFNIDKCAGIVSKQAEKKKVIAVKIPNSKMNILPAEVNKLIAREKSACLVVVHTTTSAIPDSVKKYINSSRVKIAICNHGNSFGDIKAKTKEYISKNIKG